MSVSRTVTVWCDGLDAAGCTEWTHAGPENCSTARARADAKGMGWSRAAGRDLCPECTAALAEAAAQPTDPSRDQCPEWNCPDLSTEDRREGKTCPDHPCTCDHQPTEQEQQS